MKTKSLKGMVLVLLLFVFTISAFSADAPITKDPIAKKYLVMDKFGNVTGVSNPILNEIGVQGPNGLWGNQAWLDALAGNPDKKYNEVLTDLITYSVWNGKLVWPLDKGMLMNKTLANSIEIGSLGVVLWKVANAKALLLNLFDTQDKLKNIACGNKKEIYRALWFLGDKSAADLMINAFNDDDYTVNHITETLCVLHNWGLSREQNDKIVQFSLKVFQNQASKRGKDREKAPACIRYIGMAEINNGEVNEFLKNYLGKGTQEKVEASRALGRAGVKDASTQLWDIMSKFKKVNPDKSVGYNARPESVAAAFALANLGDAQAAYVIASWVSPNPKNRQIDKSAFESAYYEAGFLNMAGRGLVQATLIGAFNAAAAANFDKNIMVRAATGLAQMGSGAGLAVITAALQGNDNMLIEDALNGIGGYQNYFQPRSGSGGINTKKSGLSRGEVDSLEKTILGRMKFWNGDQRKKGAMAILDMRARLY